MERFVEYVRTSPFLRDPPIRTVDDLDDEEKEALARRFGGLENYNGQRLRRLLLKAPDSLDIKRAILVGIANAELAGLNAFSRKVVEYQQWPVPSSLIMAMARQTWDEVRHATFALQLLESYGGRLGADLPDHGLVPGRAQARQGATGDGQAGGSNDPVASLTRVNIVIEGNALTTFAELSQIGRRIGDPLLERCYDYNWADEVTHVAIGDWFVRVLTQDDPKEEQRALRLQAQSEAARADLSEWQKEEIRQFFAEEAERASDVLTASESERYG
jgi:uncharacterized ferritin-like protein (DUF455 family)